MRPVSGFAGLFSPGLATMALARSSSLSGSLACWLVSPFSMLCAKVIAPNKSSNAQATAPAKVRESHTMIDGCLFFIFNLLFPSAEEWVFVRPMDFKVADGTIGVARVVDVVERRRARPDACPVRVGDAWRIRVAFETEEFDDVARQQFRVGRAVRRMACLTAFNLDRGELVNEGPLFVSMAFDAAHIAARRIAQRLAHESAVLVVAVGALHPAFGDFVVERLGKRGFLIGVALVAHIRLRGLQQKLSPLRSMRRM